MHGLPLKVDERTYTFTLCALEQCLENNVIFLSFFWNTFNKDPKALDAIYIGLRE